MHGSRELNDLLPFLKPSFQRGGGYSLNHGAQKLGFWNYKGSTDVFNMIGGLKSFRAVLRSGRGRRGAYNPLTLLLYQ